MKSGLDYLGKRDARVLILGSFPSKISLEKKEYYGNSTNDFWKIIGNIYQTDLSGFDYTQKVDFLMENKIALWDIYGFCEREGSLDANISKYHLNDFSILKNKFPHLEKICFNGKRASSLESELNEFGYDLYTLPSSSGANRRNQNVRLKVWEETLI